MGETTVRPMDGAVEHPRMDLLRVGERMPWRTYQLVPTFLTTYDPCIIYAGVAAYSL
ncbi:hypothetical protein [Shewanella xiamenensis]|uniref:hypothetical protein n=1 Tax=Shewanella xiamenensis TaxID=332186 RepID=UPI0024A67772|nr:hypothetical protein [Shewanella xiamenensis]MDI5876909.1 hypothetical protein [Shewanella xiamenensis]